MSIRVPLYKSKVKYVGLFGFKDFYEFCYNWIMSDIEPKDFDEKAYSEKVVGDGKNLDIDWEVEKELGAYFKYNVKLHFKTIMMKQVEVEKNGKRVKSNDGEISVEAKVTLVHDRQNKFESGIWKTWRTIYEKWIIAERIDQFEAKAIGDVDTFLSQAKAFLDLEGK